VELQTKSSKRRKSNGEIIAQSSIQSYDALLSLIIRYETHIDNSLIIYDFRKANKREVERVKKYWIKFYRSFTDFLYDELNHFDNNVGHMTKLIRTFFNWLNIEKGIDTGSFYKQFHVPKDEIPILVLEPEQLNFLIYDKEFENKLHYRLRQTKHIFVFGCTVALRFSDILTLKRSNLEVYNGKYYLSKLSQKTQTRTRVMLPDYAIEILNKYKKNGRYLLPVPSKEVFNKRLKQLLEAAGWTHIVPKIRMRRGKPVEILNNKGKSHRFCDLITSHCMRRTAITTLLRFGLEESLVRKISGHAPGSKEFYRYVELTQSYMDEEMEKVHLKIVQKQPNMTKNSENATAL